MQNHIPGSKQLEADCGVLILPGSMDFPLCRPVYCRVLQQQLQQATQQLGAATQPLQGLTGSSCEGPMQAARAQCRLQKQLTVDSWA
jgi:hypothetical protein